MYKFESIVVVFLSLYLYCGNVSAGGGNFQEMMEKCYKELSITEDLMTPWMKNGEVPNENDKNSKCFFYCILQKMEMIDDKGNFDVPKVTGMLTKKYAGVFNADEVTNLVDKCVTSRTETCLCEKSYQMSKCHMKPYLERMSKQ